MKINLYFRSKVYLVHGNEEREQKVDKKGETNLKTCSGQTISKLFGVELCSELRIPPYKPNSAMHPVNGPANFNIYIKKTDPSLKSYSFDAEWKLDVVSLTLSALIFCPLISLIGKRPLNYYLFLQFSEKWRIYQTWYRLLQHTRLSN